MKLTFGNMSMMSIKLYVLKYSLEFIFTFLIFIFQFYFFSTNEIFLKNARFFIINYSFYWKYLNFILNFFFNILFRREFQKITNFSYIRYCLFLFVSRALLVYDRFIIEFRIRMKALMPGESFLYQSAKQQDFC